MPQDPYIPSEYAMLFYDLFEDSSDAVFIVRAEDGLILDANARFLSLFGYARNEAVGRTAIELGMWVRSADRQIYLAELKKTGKIKGYQARFSNRWSEEFTLSLSSTLTRLRGDTVVLGVGTLARYDAEMTLRQALI